MKNKKDSSDPIDNLEYEKVLEEEIASQLENIKFVVNPKLLLKKITQKKFKGEKGKTLSFEFLDQK